MEVSRQTIVDQLADALDEDPAAMTDQTVLAELGGWDSIGQLAIIACIDELRGKTVDVDLLTACRTFGDLLELAREHQQGA